MQTALKTCWRVETADRVAFLMENAHYFEVLAQALRNARKSVLWVGWQFDPRTRLEPFDQRHSRSDEVGMMLRRLSHARPDLDIRMLIWKSPLLIAASQGFFPHKAQRWFRRWNGEFQLDRPRPFGACHHQKVIVIDDSIAFCGGGDVGVDRWDTAAHRDDDPRRAMPSGLLSKPRHEVMSLVSGPAARALGDLIRDRWEGATGERPATVEVADDPWPESVTPDLYDCPMGIVRTEPAWKGRAGVRESEALHLEAIARARKLIYLENQYFTSPLIGAALANRLDEPDGPEIVVISTGKSPSWFDQATMDGARRVMLERLRAADRYGRFSAWRPLTPGRKNIIVHSKVTVIDDRMIRVGSTNLNNRSFGFDTECDVAFVPEGEGPNPTITAFRRRLIGHFLGVEQAYYDDVEAVTPSIREAIEALNTGRLVDLDARAPLDRDYLLAEWGIGDPATAFDSWRPWRRRRLSEIFKREIAEAQAAPVISKSTTSGR
ncbi:phospholipase D-like domain-containing protein [Brevundimonas sp. 2R-24]|uniref:Phospholipase D n=1 Tax=Peiella sedimenti TaxID=3061083 RepID=A0ABT8SI35_9CAUL|nr:phospholipase D-like domain-containing protein [Caulobacteraceae bacterium XZ-24]